jgi:hypothetical protein
MGEEIIRHMETILYRPDKILLCARYYEGPGAILAFYIDRYEKNTVSWYWYKLKEEIKNPLTDTAHIATIHESKSELDEFFTFLTDEKAPVFRIASQFEQAVKTAMTTGLALKLIEAGVRLERTARGVPAGD